MFDSTQIKKGTGGYGRILFFGLMATLCLAFINSTAAAQTAATTPPANEEVIWKGYKLVSTVEAGWRFRRVSGSELKYRSDLNYKQGMRSFDTNIVLESESGKGKYFDSLLISNSGWGADPQGFTRVNLDKIGIYKFNANVRRVSYFNNLSNHVLGQHTSNTTNTSGDFDLSVLPQNEKIRFNFGMSFNDYRGPGVYTIRAFSDEFPVDSFTRNKSTDFRGGIEGKLLGFDLGLTQGFRFFKDRSDYSITSTNLGNNPTNNAVVTSFSRIFPTDGNSYYTALSAHRTFAEKLDFTGKFIYTSTDSDMSMTEKIIGRDNSNNIIDLDNFTIMAKNRRIQKRADFGLTYRATDNFRISNTFSFDTFTINGGEGLEEAVTRRTSAGNPLASTFTKSAAYRVNDFTRYVNTIEGDYQFNNTVSLHLGYRYAHRSINVTGFGITLTSAPSPTNPAFIAETETNSTNAFIAGMKIKPVKNWVIFWDVEKGSADNVFSRLENYKYTNFRVRTRATFNKFALNLSAISKDNSNPTETATTPPLPFGTNIKNRFYTGSVDWNPIRELSISTGYTYNHLTAVTPILVPLTGGLFLRTSEYYMRDHYGFFDVSAKPMKRVSLYASYRISRDKGQGTRVAQIAQDIVTSYPMQMQSPEFRVAFKITRNVDWNLGYQYYNYRDSQTPTLNYRAHLPYTSLRIYFGGGAADR